MSGAEALWTQETMGGMSGMNDPLLAGGARLDSEVGYGLPIGERFVGTPRAGILEVKWLGQTFTYTRPTNATKRGKNIQALRRAKPRRATPPAP